MVKLLRIDDRLLHGQVAFAWTKSLGVEAIVVANDDVVKDDLIKMSIKMAAPPEVKLAIRSIDDAVKLIEHPKTQDMSLFVVVRTAKDALRLAEKTDLIQHINVGGIKKEEGKQMLTRAVFVSDEDIQIFNQLSEMGREVELRQVPTDSKKYIHELLK
ncbi:PTS sugar transporter subunit IIB [Abyssisolibacter fermentans]|uniref:PTS sugar transporter subunit IIB n=1 Tax=Abyssisolibacter fermentans TaxID=1766203 RepID=UPI00082F5807|nr:PTS sugar transporter subunit IIB [Abyssisolibacter fermentans]